MMITKTCQVCGKPYTVKRRPSRNQRFCSKECMGKAMRAKRYKSFIHYNVLDNVDEDLGRVGSSQ